MLQPDDGGLEEDFGDLDELGGQSQLEVSRCRDVDVGAWLALLMELSVCEEAAREESRERS
eukprot:750572-Hanusia_phi.AAC.6